MPHRRWFLSFLIVPVVTAAPMARADADGVEFFEKKIRPVLVQHCYACHSAKAKKLKGGLRLDSREGLLAGGESGPVLVPRQPDKSRLIVAVGYKNVDLQMPPRGKLPDAVLADLTAWVRMGAPMPADSAGKVSLGKATIDLAERKREHWAWQPIRAAAPPQVRNTSWSRDAVDRFLLAKLEANGLTPAADADKRTLLRRLYFDLVGLPPSPSETAAFLGDSSTNAIEKVVDRLLASPHFGERWARHWLDLVRYAETRGHEFDYQIPNAYRYRDYVIRALNADVPYNQFVVEHMAGDLLPQPRRHPLEGFNESILGTAFWFLGEEVHSPVDVRQDQADRFDNKIDVWSKAFLGLTVACARCHDHKFDAISTKDYYALYGYLQSSHYRLARFDSMDHNRLVAAELWQLRDKERGAIQKAIAQALRPGVERMGDYLEAARQALSGDAKAIARTHKLDPVVLDTWVRYLRVSTLPVSPTRNNVSPTRQRESPSPSLARRANQGEMILDYAHIRPDDWLPDGPIFGPRPVQPGELRIEGDAAKPTIHFREQAAAEKDPVWDVLTLALGTENEPGALGGADRAGRTLRTPTFSLTGGKLFYLLKGRSLVYASIGSHVMIAGPLHGQLVRKIDAGDRFQWIEHDLSPYKGQRIHLEFTPTGGEFALSRIAQGDEKKVSGTFSEMKMVPDPFLQTLDKMADDRLLGSAEDARRANWMVHHADLLGTPDPGRDAIRAFLARQAKIIARIRRQSRLAPAMIDGSSEDDYVFIRGSYKGRGETVPRRFLEALTGPTPPAIAHGSGRLEWARQMIDPALDPFLPRVLVNRVWHHLFGRGIVASTDNFGVLGERPTHPELLDYLADRFVREGWSIKKLIRALVLSSAYRMASAPDAAADRIDPGNLLLHRMRLRRLEGEAIRDAMLAVSGRLVDRVYGPPVLVHLTPFQDGRGRPASGPLDGDGRRSLYLSVRRNFVSPFLLAFDTPSPSSPIGRRSVSNVPAQSLILLNDPFVHELSRFWAGRVLVEAGSVRERIVRMYESAFTRPPSEAELTACVDFLQRQPNDPAAWADLAHVLFNVKEFIFLN